MRIRFIWPGKTRDEHLRALVAEYLKRLARFVHCEVIETRAAGKEQSGVEKESRRILDAIPKGTMTVLLDVIGREWNSQGPADEVRRWENDPIKEVASVIGGPEDLSSEDSTRPQKPRGLS